MVGILNGQTESPRCDHRLLDILRTFSIALLICTLHAARTDALDPSNTLADYTLTNWSEDAGPFPFGVYAIAQDRDGYLWLGTRTGLIRFDGTNFAIWKGSEPLPDDRVSAICIARDGTMWLGFGTIGGVTRIRAGKVTNFGKPEGLTGEVNALLEDDGDAIWAGTYGGLYKFVNNRWEHLGAAQGLPTESVTGLFKDSRRNFWVGTSVGVYRRRSGDNEFRFFAPSTVVDFAEDSAATIWATDVVNAFTVLDAPARSARASLGWKEALGRRLLYDRSGSLWIGTRGSGLLRVRDLNGATSQTSIERLTRDEGLPSAEIRALFEDRDGTLWIGTRMGLSRLSESNIRTALGRRADAFVSSVTRARDGSVWVGTYEGLRHLTRDHEQTYSVAHGLPSQIVTGLHEDRGGTLWVATTRGIARLSDGRFTALAVPQDMRLNRVLSMTSDRTGGVWLCDQARGLVQWKDGKLTRMKDMFRDGPAYVAYADAADRVWIGFWNGGMAVYHDNTIDRYSVADGLPNGSVNIIHQDQSGTIWVGTSKGLRRFDRGRFVTFAANGFPESAVVSIVEGEEGYLWFGLASGLLRISRDEFDRVAGDPAVRLRYKLYGVEDGLMGTLGRPGMPSSTRSADGRLWFLTSVGLVTVDPGRLRARPAPGPLRIESVVADGRVIEPLSQLRLAPHTSRMQINYSILSLSAATKLRFRYKLEDFDSDWQEAGEQRQAFYTNLTPGSYRFRVVSNTNDGGWNATGAELNFSIEPAFYQTKIFYGAVVTMVALTIWSIWQLRLRRMRRQFDLVLAERARMGREIHDTLLQSLVGVALEFDDISSQLDPSATSLKAQVCRIREQVEHYIREARHSIWNLRSPTLETIDLSAALLEAGEAATAGGHARFEFVVNGTARWISASVEEQLLRIGQEALSNAVRHGAADVIRIELSYRPDSVSLRVSDNGRGFDSEHVAQAPESHWGLTSMRERAQQVGARFILMSRPGAGTTIEAIASISSNK